SDGWPVVVCHALLSQIQPTVSSERVARAAATRALSLYSAGRLKEKFCRAPHSAPHRQLRRDQAESGRSARRSLPVPGSGRRSDGHGAPSGWRMHLGTAGPRRAMPADSSRIPLAHSYHPQSSDSANEIPGLSFYFLGSASASIRVSVALYATEVRNHGHLGQPRSLCAYVPGAIAIFLGFGASDARRERLAFAGTSELSAPVPTIAYTQVRAPHPLACGRNCGRSGVVAGRRLGLVTLSERPGRNGCTGP